MSIKIINLGTEPDGLGGDTLRSSATKTNENFTFVNTELNGINSKLNESKTEMLDKNTRVTNLESKTDTTDVKVKALEDKNIVTDNKISTNTTSTAANTTELANINTYLSNSVNAASKQIGTTNGKIPLVENIESLAKTSELQDSINALLGYTKTLENKLYNLTPFTPYHLFRDSTVSGVWYDPSDLSTMFQDADGTIPVTKNGDPVGLILDKSKGLELASNKITNGDFSDGLNNWSNNGGDEATVVNGVFTPTGVVRYANKITLEVGKTYLIETDIDNEGISSSNYKLRISAHDNNSFYSGNYLGSSYTGRLIIRGHTSTNITIYLFSQLSTLTTVSNITIRELKGNHAKQTVSAARPLYRTGDYLGGIATGKDTDLHWLEFDGVDDKLDFQKTIPFMDLYLSASRAANLNTAIVGGTGNTYITMYSKGTRYRATEYESHLIDIENDPAILNYTYNENSIISAWVNGVKAQGDYYRTKSNLVNLGNAGSSYYQGNIYGLIIIENHVAESKVKTTAYLTNKSGVTI